MPTVSVNVAERCVIDKPTTIITINPDSLQIEGGRLKIAQTESLFSNSIKTFDDVSVKPQYEYSNFVTLAKDEEHLLVNNLEASCDTKPSILSDSRVRSSVNEIFVDSTFLESAMISDANLKARCASFADVLVSRFKTTATSSDYQNEAVNIKLTGSIELRDSKTCIILSDVEII